MFLDDPRSATLFMRVPSPVLAVMRDRKRGWLYVASVQRVAEQTRTPSRLDIPRFPLLRLQVKLIAAKNPDWPSSEVNAKAVKAAKATAAASAAPRATTELASDFADPCDDLSECFLRGFGAAAGDEPQASELSSNKRKVFRRTVAAAVQWPGTDPESQSSVHFLLQLLVRVAPFCLGDDG